MSRYCRPCQACCFAITTWDMTGDEKLFTPAFEECPNQCEHGCSVYENRPLSCARYSCLWLAGWGGDRWRPDRLGLVAENAPPGARGTILTEWRRGALASKEGRRAVADLVRDRMPVLVVLHREPGDQPAFDFHGKGKDVRSLLLAAVTRQEDGCLVPKANA